MCSGRASVYISVKGPPKKLNLTTIEITTSWPKIMFECCPRMQVDAIRHPLLIYALKTGIKMI